MSSEKNQKNNLLKFKKRNPNEERELTSLLDIGAALSSEHETHKVLTMILEKATENTNSDGGSIYLVEREKETAVNLLNNTKPRTMLSFSHSLSASLNSSADLGKKLLELNSDSIAGYVASTGHSIRVRDAYLLPKDAPFKFNPELDRLQGYRTKSILSVPIRTNKGRILGVVQLVNKRREFRRREDLPPTKKRKLSEKAIIAFSEHDDRLIHAFASHAAVALENAKLTQDISNLFESFVKASVTAIEARDPSSGGHSERVANLTVKLAETVDRISDGIFKDIKFTPDQIREIRYASLLHDFGKIGVREAVLVKGEKLFPHELETVLLRLRTVSSINEARVWRDAAERLVELIMAKKEFDPQGHLGQALWNVDGFNKKIEFLRRGILKANESQILDRDFDIGALMDEIKGTSQDIGQKILEDHEVVKLSVKRGTLSPQERFQIESHVSHTFEFLSQIAWTDQLQHVPEIAHAHHEKLDGTGYPRHLKADQIPIQSRMMTVADIYDALTAFDRPYKKAVNNERAIDILQDEAKSGKLDSELLKIFVEARVFEAVAGMRNKKAG